MGAEVRLLGFAYPSFITCMTLGSYLTFLSSFICKMSVAVVPPRGVAGVMKMKEITGLKVLFCA